MELGNPNTLLKTGGNRASGTIGVVGTGCRKKQTPDCNGLDRGQTLTRKGADVRLTNHDELEVKSMNVKCSTTLTSEDSTDRELARQWNHFPWDKAYSYVNRLQTRIAKAVKEGKTRLARRLQYILTHSYFAKALAVKKVTENKGKRTAGVDGVRWKTPTERMRAAISLIDKGYKAKPLARIYIPKPNSDKMRPLSIPTFYDRAMQALYALALQPWAETTADITSFGFRLYKCAQDAAAYLFICLSKDNSAQYVLEGDIRGCFDNIKHEWLLENIPMDKKVLAEFLKAGYLYEGVYHNTSMGTAQGGIISPILANLTLDGLKTLLTNQFKNKKVNLVRYADDWVITAELREVAEQVKTAVEGFLAERGLSLSEEKTKIVHIDEGFDFLSWNFRKYSGKLLIKPSKKAVATITRTISDIIRCAKSMSQELLIKRLNPIIQGWSIYHRNVVSSETFSSLDHTVWGLLWHWAKRRHPNMGHRWIVQRYWHSVDNLNWVFTTFASTLRLFSDTKIRRHILAQLERNPFLNSEYFSKRQCDSITKQTTVYSFF
jgi:RNA-directed DNA polymerase